MKFLQQIDCLAVCKLNNVNNLNQFEKVSTVYIYMQKMTLYHGPVFKESLINLCVYLKVIVKAAVLLQKCVR